MDGFDPVAGAVIGGLVSALTFVVAKLFGFHNQLMADKDSQIAKLSEQVLLWQTMVLDNLMPVTSQAVNLAEKASLRRAS